MLAAGPLVGGAGLGSLGLNHERQPIEELPHAGRQRAGELVERARDILLKRRRRQTLDERATEIQRAQFGEREAGVVEPLEGALLEHPVALAVDDLVVEWESCGLERFEIAPDGSSRDAGLLREIVDVRATGGFQLAEDAPLADDFGVSWHRLRR